jgi:hypothetical protein
MATPANQKDEPGPSPPNRALTSSPAQQDDGKSAGFQPGE